MIDRTSPDPFFSCGRDQPKYCETVPLAYDPREQQLQSAAAAVGPLRPQQLLSLVPTTSARMRFGAMRCFLGLVIRALVLAVCLGAVVDAAGTSGQNPITSPLEGIYDGGVAIPVTWKVCWLGCVAVGCWLTSDGSQQRPEQFRLSS